jgi:hypothetical protein
MTCEHILSAKARPRPSSGLEPLSSAKLDDVASSSKRIASLTIIFHPPMNSEKSQSSPPTTLRKIKSRWLTVAARSRSIAPGAWSANAGWIGPNQRASKPAVSSRVCMRAVKPHIVPRVKRLHRAPVAGGDGADQSFI